MHGGRYSITMYNLSKIEIFLLKKYGKLLAKKQRKKVWFPHEVLLIALLKRFNKDSFQKYREGSRFISEYHYGFSVGKYSYGYEQFWEGNNLKNNLKTIGAFCSIARNVLIPDGNHPLNYVSSNPFLFNKGFGFVEQDLNISKYFKSQDIIIGNDVWIGQNVILMPGISIGDGAVIGAGAIITKSIPPFAIVAGVPGKILRYRFDQDKINQILQSKWWEWSDETIKAKLDKFYDINDFGEVLSS